jgi:hypothetical protein
VRPSSLATPRAPSAAARAVRQRGPLARLGLALLPLAHLLSLACGQPAPAQPPTSSIQSPPLPRTTETAGERRARLLASQPELNGFLIEGPILATHCAERPPTVVLGPTSAPLTVRVESPGFDCLRARPGDYLFVVAGTRRSDALVDAARLILDPQ